MFKHTYEKGFKMVQQHAQALLPGVSRTAQVIIVNCSDGRPTGEVRIPPVTGMRLEICQNFR